MFNHPFNTATSTDDDCAPIVTIYPPGMLENFCSSTISKRKPKSIISSNYFSAIILSVIVLCALSAVYTSGAIHVRIGSYGFSNNSTAETFSAKSFLVRQNPVLVTSNSDYEPGFLSATNKRKAQSDSTAEKSEDEKGLTNALTTGTTCCPCCLCSSTFCHICQVYVACVSVTSIIESVYFCTKGAPVVTISAARNVMHNGCCGYKLLAGRAIDAIEPSTFERPMDRDLPPGPERDANNILTGYYTILEALRTDDERQIFTNWIFAYELADIQCPNQSLTLQRHAMLILSRMRYTAAAEAYVNTIARMFFPEQWRGLGTVRIAEFGTLDPNNMIQNSAYNREQNDMTAQFRRDHEVTAAQNVAFFLINFLLRTGNATQLRENGNLSWLSNLDRSMSMPQRRQRPLSTRAEDEQGRERILRAIFARETMITDLLAINEDMAPHGSMLSTVKPADGMRFMPGFVACLSAFVANFATCNAFAVWHAGTCCCEDKYWHCLECSEMVDISLRVFLRILDVYICHDEGCPNLGTTCCWESVDADYYAADSMEEQGLGADDIPNMVNTRGSEDAPREEGSTSPVAIEGGVREGGPEEID